jgi:aromatic ring-cleaving dioxygenase
MFKINKIIVPIVLLLITYTLCHSAGYVLPKFATKLDKQPPAISYHIHVVFNLDVPEALKAAIDLREAAREKFKELLGPDCDGRYDNARLCLIFDHDIGEVLKGGPFLSGEWSMFVPVPYVQAVLFWFTQNYHSVPTASLLLHPNTGFEYEDHSEWALWAGGVQEINMSIFSKGEQTNEFDQLPGSPGNPLCLKESSVCSQGSLEGPFLGCCHGLACQCTPQDNSCVCKLVNF